LTPVQVGQPIEQPCENQKHVWSQTADSPKMSKMRPKQEPKGGHRGHAAPHLPDIARLCPVDALAPAAGAWPPDARNMRKKKAHEKAHEKRAKTAKRDGP
jgi:hypothetical protein